MQPRGSDNMDIESEEHVTPQQSRGRNNSKSKVLVRSHAMREEASPPREPTPTALNSPSIKLTPSSDSHPPSPNRSVLVLSPSVSRDNSPSYTPNHSPTSTLVPSPTPYSPSYHHSQQIVDMDFTDLEMSPKVNRMNRQNLERYNGRSVHKTDIIVEETSHSKRKAKCECTNHNCANCFRNQERNHNNNISSSNNNNTSCANTLTVNRVNGRGKLRQQSSSQGSFEGSAANSPCLSRDNSSEQYTDTTGIDLEIFIPETLNRNAKDRALMLRIEEELVNLAQDKVKSHFKFPPMSSYQRMLVHRCAAYFGMDHNIESSGKCVVVNKTKNTRIPEMQFRIHIKDDIVFSEEPRRSILKRDSNSIEDYNFKSPDRQFSLESRRSKSFEERTEEYEKVRRRIFNKERQECGSTDDLDWSEDAWASSDADSLSQSHRFHSEFRHGRNSGRLLKVQSEETGDETLRPHVAKSYSFGGYAGVLARGDSLVSTHSAGPRLLTKQDSGASSVSWRLSPSSSGYKTQSQRSESITPSPTSTPYLSGESTRQDSTNSTNTNTSDIHQEEDSQYVWAVTNINKLSIGSIIINPQTGQPLKNVDGTIYHYDPDCPFPDISDQRNMVRTKPPVSPSKSAPKIVRERPQSPKKRSRSSPVKKTNSATSPSLPYTPPPLLPNRTYSFVSTNSDHSVQAPLPAPQQQFPVYPPPSFTPDNPVPMYQPHCFVFAPYNHTVPVPYDSRMEPQQVQDGFYSIQESIASQPPTHSLTYQPTAAPPPMWGQQPITFYQNASPANTQTRFAMPIPQQSTYITQYAPNYLPPQPTLPPAPEIYPQQPLPLIYPVQSNQSNAVVYPNQNLIYSTHNPQMYTNSIYPNISYPPNTPTPSSCTSSVSNTPYHGQIYDTNLGQVVQGMAQMTMSTKYDGRMLPSKGKYNNSKGMCSSQSSSTETNSSPMTVVAGYCHNQMQFKSPPAETPPLNAAFASTLPPPVVFRQMSNVSVNAPVTSRGSRSPTPASESHIERQRFSLPPPPLMYQAMPYTLQTENRIVPGRGQPTAYRHTPVRQHSINQSSENKSNNKSRRSRGNKTSNPPQNGKQQQH